MPTANIQRAECGQNAEEGLTRGGEASREGFLEKMRLSLGRRTGGGGVRVPPPLPTSLLS